MFVVNNMQTKMTVSLLHNVIGHNHLGQTWAYSVGLHVYVTVLKTAQGAKQAVTEIVILTTIRAVCKCVLTNMSFSSRAAAIPLQSSRKFVYV